MIIDAFKIAIRLKSVEYPSLLHPLFPHQLPKFPGSITNKIGVLKADLVSNPHP
jgi:hypothetical protein